MRFVFACLAQNGCGADFSFDERRAGGARNDGGDGARPGLSREGRSAGNDLVYLSDVGPSDEQSVINRADCD